MKSQTDGLRAPDRRVLFGDFEILRVLVHKELKVKYKRSVLGFAWSLVTPVALMLVYLFVFIHVYKVPQKDFSFFLLSGLLPWNFFNMSILAATGTLVDNGPLIRKVFFPRAFLPIATVSANLINFLMGMIILSAALIWSGRPIWEQVHWLVLAIILESVLCCGVALALSAWNVFLRDIQQLISIMMLVLFFATPIVYDVDKVPASFKWIILINPVAPIMHMYRSSLFHVRSPDLGLVAIAAMETFLVFGIGLLAFRRISPQLAKEV